MGSPLQQWLHSIVGTLHRWCGWAIAVPDPEFATKADLAAAAVDQPTAGLGFAPWSFEIAGGDRMRSSSGAAPYFIRYGHDASRHAEVLRGRVGRALPDGVAGFKEVLIGDPDRVLDQWLAQVGGAPPAVGIDDGAARGVLGVAIGVTKEVVHIDLSDR